MPGSISKDGKIVDVVSIYLYLGQKIRMTGKKYGKIPIHSKYRTLYARHNEDIQEAEYVGENYDQGSRCVYVANCEEQWVGHVARRVEEKWTK